MKGIKYKKLIYIEWIDAISSSGWSTPEEHQPDYCFTLGFLVYESKEAFTVAATTSLEEVNAVMVVPKAWCKVVKRFNTNKLNQLLNPKS